MSKKDPVSSTTKPTKLALKKQTVRDLATTKSTAAKVRGGVAGSNTTSNIVDGASRYCAAMC